MLGSYLLYVIGSSFNEPPQSKDYFGRTELRSHLDTAYDIFHKLFVEHSSMNVV